MPPRRTKAETAPVAERVRVATPPPPPSSSKASADQIFNQLISSVAAATNDAPYVPTSEYSPVSEYTPLDAPYVSEYSPQNTSQYTPHDTTTAPTNAYTNGSNSFAYSNASSTSAYNPNAYNPNAYNPNAYNYNAPAAPAPPPPPTTTKPRYTNNDGSYRRERSRSPVRRERSRSPSYSRRERSPYRRRSPSPRNRVRRAPAIPTAVALDLLTWIPAHIWREHGYQPPVKL